MKINRSIATLLLLVNETFIFLGCNLSAILPRSTFTKYHLLASQYPCEIKPVPVTEPLLESAIVRIDRGRYVIAVRLDFLAIKHLFACRRGDSLVLDLPGKEQR